MLLLFWHGAGFVLAERATATAGTAAAAISAGATLGGATATAGVAAPASAFIADTRLPAQVATASASAVAPAITAAAVLAGALAIATAVSLTARLQVDAQIVALVATALAAALAGVWITSARLSAAVATANAQAPPGALRGGTTFYAELMTVTTLARASVQIGGARIAPAAATVTATARVAQVFDLARLPAAVAIAFAVGQRGFMPSVGKLLAERALANTTAIVAVVFATAVLPAETATASAIASGTISSNVDYVGRIAVVIGPPVLSGEAEQTGIIYALASIEVPPPILTGVGTGLITGFSNFMVPPPILTSGAIGHVLGWINYLVPPPRLTTVGTIRFTGQIATVIPVPIILAQTPTPPMGVPPPLSPTDVHIIEAYDINGVLLGRVQPIRRAKFTMIENDVGDFEIELPWIYDDVINIVQARNRLEYSIRGKKVFGGFVMKRQFKQEGRYSMVTLSGPGYNALLTGRIMIPPATQNADVYTNLKADDLMKNIVRNHLGSNAAVARRPAGFTVASNLGQSSVLTNYNGRYETVIDALKSIGKADENLKFLVVRRDDGLLEFRTYVPIIGIDRSVGTSDPAIFDMGGGNALNIEYTEDGTGVRNYIYGGGTGDEAARLIREGFNAESINDWGRIEEFLDTSAKTSPELDLEILKELDEKSRAGPSLTFTVGRAGRYEFPEDFYFGDKVSAFWKEAGLTLTDVISGITINLEENGVMEIDLSIGEPNLFRLSPGRGLARFIRALRGEVGIMQRH